MAIKCLKLNENICCLNLSLNVRKHVLTKTVSTSAQNRIHIFLSFFFFFIKFSIRVVAGQCSSSESRFANKRMFFSAKNTMYHERSLVYNYYYVHHCTTIPTVWPDLWMQINVGHGSMICPISWRLFYWWSQYDTKIDSLSNIDNSDLYFMVHRFCFTSWKCFSWMNVKLSENEPVWCSDWPHNKYRLQWPTFHGKVILLQN